MCATGSYVLLLGTEIETHYLSADDILSLSQSQSQEDDQNDEDYFPSSGSASSILSGFSEVTNLQT
jgi:hypothetical protein